MAYYTSGHSGRVNYWSNPGVIYPVTGTPTGVTDVSDNARLLTENRSELRGELKPLVVTLCLK